MSDEKLLTLDSTVEQIYAHPVGHDVLKRVLLAMGKSDGLLRLLPVKHLRLKTLARFTKSMLGDDFWNTFLTLLNSEQDVPDESTGAPTPAWWKEAVFYQVYPRSFCDADGDGVGDLAGILERLDYLKNLGVDTLWLSPVYDSPNDDNGYDIRDYQKIMAEFGTMEQFDALLAAVHRCGMRLVMDLVVNHTSDEHAWFKKALANSDSPYRDYYFFKPGAPDAPPNNWTSFFSGSAWNYYKQTGEWALHLFSQKQMDLNWECPALRHDIEEMIRWWLAKGVDGFRMDVINYISKTPGLPDGSKKIGQMMGFCGIEHYFYGPHLHEHLREIRREAFAPYKAFSVGETPGVGMEMAKLLTGDQRGELDMLFSFDHLETPGHARFDAYEYDLNYLKDYYTDWMLHYGPHCWMSLFYENHDNPRMISKVNADPSVRAVLGKLLAMIQFTLRGTPFVYEGQELGSVNINFKDISELHDVESLNLYAELVKTMPAQQAFEKVLSGTRDHARAMMRWDDADAQQLEEDSVYAFYRKLIALRRQYRTLIYGDFAVVGRNRKDVWAYTRTGEDSAFYVVCNLGKNAIPRTEVPRNWRLILSNYKEQQSKMQPYEACLYLK
ncbi:MAG: alpha-glucosidase [Ruthenibacterium sp.]